MTQDNNLAKLNEVLEGAGVEALSEVDQCPERTAYITHKEEENWGDKAWEAQLKKLKGLYKTEFHKYLGEVYPYLRYERGEDKSYWNYEPESGVYVELSFPQVRSLVIKLLMDEGFSAEATESTAKGVLNKYRSWFKARGSEYDDFDSDNGWFHAANGWLSLDGERKFEAHSPERLSRLKSAVEYQEGATCERYDQFLDKDLELKEDQVRVIDQFSGLCLTNSVKEQKMLTLLGRPGCGKSTLLNTWVHVLGDLSLEWRLTDLSGDRARFSGSNFIGRKLCWFDEVDVHKAEMGNQLGTLITGEHLTVERKGITGVVRVDNQVKCVLTANNLPMNAEQGMFRRLIMINIPVSFSDRGTEDREMPEKLKSEASGVLNRMLDGLDDLRKMRGFTVMEGHEDLVEEYKVQSDNVSEFLEEYFEPVVKDAEHATVESIVLIESLKSYFRGNRYIESLSPQKIGKMLGNPASTKFAHIYSGRTMNGRRWHGLKLKEGFNVDPETNIIYSTAGDEGGIIRPNF